MDRIVIPWRRLRGGLGLNRLDFGGWYDSCVGIDGESMTLLEFCLRLGISPAELRKTAKLLEVPA
jgi:hypothetical protein